ncbi:ABC transporter ATP-binding protein [Erysipelothrix inopinata]|uniref:ABC transporter ATP-binding protein n=1 Tax=Erysipelothrix inopinata TaxID=225084 RepID=A0A7G9S066_9FIRM|nr:ABC transporter ATP-binding protein [Erysipelothrix inopinata]QNN61241.1 ABC transporter ATP-binding protein [Erysipelothrix inopinata]
MNKLHIEKLQRELLKDNALNVKFKCGPVNLDVQGGQIIGVFGENGSGKTTFIKLLTGIKYKDSGIINFNDKDWFNNDLAYIPDLFPFGPATKVSEILKLHETLFGNLWDRDTCLAYLDKYHVDETSSSKNLSLGMKQRLMVAVALSHKPKLLIFDEPMAGIDPFVRSEILDDIIDYTYENESVTIISTHNIEEVNDVVDYVLYFDEGYPIINADIVEFSNIAHQLIESDSQVIDIKEFVSAYQRR